MKNKSKTIIARLRLITLRRWGTLFEAIGNSTLALLMIRLLPYKVWRDRLGEPISLKHLPSSTDSAQLAQEQSFGEIAWAHQVLSNNLSWMFTCLMLGFSARAMLRRRKHSAILVLGVESSLRGANEKMGAHAWVICDGFDVAGGKIGVKYNAVAAFRDRKVEREL